MAARGIKVSPLSYVRIEAIARYAREVLVPGLRWLSRVPGPGLFERLGELTVKTGGRDVRVTYHCEASDSVEGFTRYDAAEGRLIVTLSERTYERLERDEPRARFTLLHEVGHALMHIQWLIRMGEMPHFAEAMLRASTTHKIYCDSEWQANTFASAFLAPATAVIEMIDTHGPDVDAIAATFGMSNAAAAVRLKVCTSRRGELTMA